MLSLLKILIHHLCKKWLFLTCLQFRLSSGHFLVDIGPWTRQGPEKSWLIDTRTKKEAEINESMWEKANQCLCRMWVFRLKQNCNKHYYFKNNKIETFSNMSLKSSPEWATETSQFDKEVFPPTSEFITTYREFCEILNNSIRRSFNEGCNLIILPNSCSAQWKL